MSRSLAIAASSLFFAGWLFVPSSARARGYADAQKVTVDILPNTPRVVTFDSQIIGVVRPLPKGVSVEVFKTSDQLIVTLEGKKPPSSVPVLLRTYTAVLDLRLTDDRDKATPPLNVENDALRLLQAQLVQSQQRNKELAIRLEQTEQGRAELAAENTKLAKHASHYAELSLLRQFDGKHSIINLMKSVDDCRGADVMLCGLQWNRLRDRGVLRFVVYNPTLQDIKVSQVFALRRGGDDVAGAAILGETALEDGATGTIRPMQRVHASVIVHEPDQVGEQIQLVIAGANRSPIASRHVSIQIIDWRPQSGEGRVTIRVQPSIGAVWLANPVNKDELDAAALMGLGVRVSYGLHTKFTVDTELAGIQSTDASFREVSYEGTTGDMLRSTKGARFLLGGSLRLGRKYQPFFRLGVGAQIANHDVRFISGQNNNKGPGDGLSFDGLGWFGTGLDIHLGSHWTVGAGLSAAFQTGGAKTLEGGVQLGYGWGGYVRN